MEDVQNSNQTIDSAQSGRINIRKGLQVGLIFLGKFVGGFLLAVGILGLIVFFLNPSNLKPMERLPSLVFSVWLIVPGLCLWIRAGQAAFGFWRGVCTLAGAFFVTSSVLNFLVLLAVQITGMNKSGEQVLSEGMVLCVCVLGLVLGIPLLIFGFRPKKGLKSNDA